MNIETQITEGLNALFASKKKVPDDPEQTGLFDPVLYRVCVIQDVASAFLDKEDIDSDFVGDHFFQASSKEDALDQFHSTVPVNVVENYLYMTRKEEY